MADPVTSTRARRRRDIRAKEDSSHPADDTRPHGRRRRSGGGGALEL